MSKKTSLVLSALCASLSFFTPAMAQPTEQVLLNNLQKTKAQYGANDCRTAEMYFATGKFYHAQHQNDKAQAMFEDAMKVFEKTPGNNGDMLRYYSDALARVYMEQGNSAKAETLFKKSIAIAQKLPLREKSCALPNTLAGVAKLYQSQGRYAEAESALKERIALRKRFMNAGQVDVAIVDLANLYTCWSKFDQAKPLFEELLKISPMPVEVKVGYTDFLNKSSAEKRSNSNASTSQKEASLKPAATTAGSSI